MVNVKIGLCYIIGSKKCSNLCQVNSLYSSIEIVNVRALIYARRRTHVTKTQATTENVLVAAML